MKKLLLILIIGLILPLGVSASETAYTHKILYTHGLSEVATEVNYISAGNHQHVIFHAEDPADIKIDGHEITSDQDEVYVLPAMPGMNDYTFWKLTGEYQGESFWMIGYTNDIGGDTWLERNGFAFDLINYGSAAVILLIIFFIVYKGKKKQRVQKD